MATTIVNGSIEVTITETVELLDAQNYDHGFTLTNKITIPNIDEVVTRIVTVPITETGLLSFSDAPGSPPAGTPQDTYLAGHFVKGDVRYLRITNKDNANFAQLIFRSTNGHEFALKLPANESFILPSSTSVDTMMDASATALSPLTFEDLEDITAEADTADVDLTVVVAVV